MRREQPQTPATPESAEGRRRARLLLLGAAVVATVMLGLAGCTSSSGTVSSGDQAQASAPSTSSAAEDDDDDDDDAVGGGSDVQGSTFADARAVLDAFLKAGGTCENPKDSGLSVATSSLDCTGPSGGTQTIAVFATEDEAKKWYDAQTVVKTDASTSYLLGGNWAMVADATSMNAGQKLGVRDQTIVMN
ncbi:hypothetical protein NY547_08215 [Cnuibacter physcomitrellae]|uniref:hypothetical protein n=1 Tax=Cnuibacter physcomitrellae TaxID=1619308 RepID=UPI00217571C1|nr:hypothetical protein [Cnuibacter physcomitrellae]MCS5497215.1 hypothetical protein [Cnuibacter physcomitrellae]